MRTPTDRGDVWFKANLPEAGFEAALVQVLARRRPDVVPELLAADLDRGWLLMADGGLRLRELVELERDLGRWLEILSRYAELQLDLGPGRRRARRARRAGPQAGRAARAVRHARPGDHGLSPDEGRRVRGLVPRVRELCEELAAVGIPETIEHDDLHDGQVFVQDGRYLFFDWGDACVAHPFLTLSVTLEGVLAWGLDDVEGSMDVMPFRDAYLVPFANLASRPELERACAIALRLGWISRALGYHMTPWVKDPAATDDLRTAVARMLRMFLQGDPETAGHGPGVDRPEGRSSVG